MRAVEKRAGRLSYVRRRQLTCTGPRRARRPVPRFPPSRPNRAPGGRDVSGRYSCFTKVSASMDDEPREQISELEVQIEELTDALERCRKTALASKAAMGLGGILMAAIILRVVTFDPMMMVAGLAALLGGTVVFGSNTSTANQLSEAMRSAESQRAALIDRLNICLVEDAPQIGIPDGTDHPKRRWAPQPDRSAAGGD